MRKSKILALALVLAGLETSQAMAEACNSGFYLDMAQRARNMRSEAFSCERYARRHQSNIAGVCHVCRPAITHAAVIIQQVRSHQACFNANQQGRQAMRKILAAQSPIAFMRRGCGY